MKQEQGEIRISTNGRGLYEITEPVARWLEERGLRRGLLTLLIRHTSASLVVQENADPEVLRDLERFFARLVPDGDRLFRHTEEGPDDMPSHVRAALTQVSLSMPVDEGNVRLGVWQGIFVYEHRHAAHERRIAVHFLGT
jgi:secondary thiamine-phosphate synthase enzyme